MYVKLNNSEFNQEIMSKIVYGAWLGKFYECEWNMHEYYYTKKRPLAAAAGAFPANSSSIMFCDKSHHQDFIFSAYMEDAL